MPEPFASNTRSQGQRSRVSLWLQIDIKNLKIGDFSREGNAKTTLANTWYVRLWVCSRTTLRRRQAITVDLECHPQTWHFKKCHKPAGNSRRLETERWLSHQIPRLTDGVNARVTDSDIAGHNVTLLKTKLTECMHGCQSVARHSATSTAWCRTNYQTWHILWCRSRTDDRKTPLRRNCDSPGSYNRQT